MPMRHSARIIPRSVTAALLPTAALTWLAIICAAPIALRQATTPLAAIAVYQGSSLLCHQRPERSFRVAGVQMPVCARCLALYASCALGAVAAWIVHRRPLSPSRSLARSALAAAALPMLLSVGLEWTGVIEGSNISRFVSALPLGSTAGWLLQRVATATGSDAMRYHSVRHHI
jgi:uncharacterized membrane protein